MNVSRVTVEGERDRITGELLQLLAKRAELDTAITKLYALLEGFALCMRALDSEANAPIPPAH
jgi:hypothetical protein